MVGSHHADSLGCAAGNEDGGKASSLKEKLASVKESRQPPPPPPQPPMVMVPASPLTHPRAATHWSEKGAGKSDEENRGEVTRLYSWSTSSRRVSSQSRNQFTQLPEGTLRAINKVRVFTLTQTFSNRPEQIFHFYYFTIKEGEWTSS